MTIKTPMAIFQVLLLGTIALACFIFLNHGNNLPIVVYVGVFLIGCIIRLVFIIFKDV